MKKVIIIVVCLILMIGCFFFATFWFSEKEIEPKYIKQLINEVDVFSVVNLNDIFDPMDVEVTSDNELIDTETIGERNYEIHYKYKWHKYKTILKVNVVDKVEPRYLGGTNKTIVKGYEGDVCELLFYGDNYDRNVKCTIEGNYSVNDLGTYNVNYILTDSSNNSITVPVTINVVSSTNSSNNNDQPKKYNFSNIYNIHKNDNTEIGIDVSKWQGDIDFNAVKNAGATFVMMRIGVQSTVDGELSMDTYYKENIKKAKEAGLKVGVYLYTIANDVDEAVSHAKWVIDALDGEGLDLPIVFDWESWQKWHSFSFSFHDINSIANSFIDTVNKNGYEGMLYSSKYYLQNIWENSMDYKVWLAHYTDQTDYEGEYMIWQMCNTGRIDGIKGDVDIDILYK